MKINDTYPISLQEWQVAEARVINVEDGQVTLEIPATRIVMGIKTSLTDLAERAAESEIHLLGQEPETQVSGTPNTAQLESIQTQPQSTDPTQLTQNQEVDPVPAIAPVVQPAINDNVGEGLANYKLKEME